MKFNFVHLRVRSSYSLSEGSIKIEDLVKLCITHKMPALAITDNGNLFCSLEFSKSCSDKGIQPIIGCLLMVEYAENEIAQLVVIAKDEQGYKNLLKLVSSSFLEHNTPSPHIKFSDLAQFNIGLIILTGGYYGIIDKLLLDNNANKAEEYLLNLKKIFGDRVYIELMRHNTPSKVEHQLIDLAYKHDIALVATNDAYFAHRDMHEAQEVLLCIADGKYISTEDRRKLSTEQYFKSAEEMCKLFADIPEAIENTIVIAQRCSVKSEEHPPALPSFVLEENRNVEDALKYLAKIGLEQKLHDYVLTENMSSIQREETVKLYNDRLEYELSVITNMKFSGYFLIVSDFIKWSKNNSIPVGPGRGSGAGSLVAWSLDITDLNPIRFGLLFERFLNQDRISMPDFDIDFCQEKRDEVINYVREKYGYNKVAQIITFGKLQARAALRDVGRVLQMPYSQVDKIAKMVPFNAINPVTLSQAIEMEPSLKNAKEEDPEVAKLLSIALQLEGLNRHASTHAAGIVISSDPLDEIVPLYKDPNSDMLVIQYSMKYAESVGLVKFDFLGLKTLTVISHTCKLIQSRGINIVINNIVLDDINTYNLLSQGNSVGIFQFEGAGMRDALRKLKPDSIEDLIALGALYRPGPMENIPTYIACKHGIEKPNYLHPKLEDVLKETFGVIIYQEQVMQIAQILAGYTLHAADLLRRAMGKKIKAEMDAQRELFIKGAINNGVDKEQASTIFDLVAKFAGYGFNKSHAAAYAIISYQTAYLKANFPVEFIVASMNLEIDDTDKINIFREEAILMNIKILPPDINKSEGYFCIELHENKPAIRYGLGAIKGVGVHAIELVVTERKSHGEFKNIFDLATRIDPKSFNKRQFEGLIKSGSLDKLNSNRRQLLESLELITKYSSSIQREKNSIQASLFGGMKEISKITEPELLSVDNWDENEQLQQECEAIGFYLSAHPLDKWKLYLHNHNIKNSSYLREDLSEGFSSIKLAGIINTVKTRVSPRGRFVSAQVSDPYGIYEISIFNNDIITNDRELLTSKLPLLINAECRKDEGGVRLTVQNIQKLDEFLHRQYSMLQIWIDGQEAVTAVKSLCSTPNTDGMKVKIFVIDHSKQEEIALDLPGQYQISPTNSLLLENSPGIIKVQLK
ncbi:DNA polymerase III subunit alpha [Rickettsiales bacterium Ac37b]|nr:DNA polymerase III subunit alpha [Rickettsiales bacterium Ac37b]